MYKKIIFIIICILALLVILSACEEKENIAEAETTGEIELARDDALENAQLPETIAFVNTQMQKKYPNIIEYTITACTRYDSTGSKYSIHIFCPKSEINNIEESYTLTIIAKPSYIDEKNIEFSHWEFVKILR